MTNQINEAVERYKLEIVNNDGDRYIRCEPAPNGSWVMFKDVAALQARIAELEVAIYQYVNHVVSYEGTSFIDEMNGPPWAKLINDTWVKQAALAGGEDGPA